MISKEELRKFAHIVGFNLWQTEKDYLQHLFLMFLSKETKKQLVFKGGTALQKVYGLNRFSVDLDFTSLSDGSEKIIECVSRDIAMFGFENKFSEVSKKFGKTFVLKIKGPLYDGSERSLSTLRVEISLRRDLILKPEVKEIVPIYPDIKPYLVLVMKPEEILAEKIRAICWRGKPRDVYDLWFLLKKGVKFDPKLATKKLEFYGLKFDKHKFKEKLEEIGKSWEDELEQTVGLIPEFTRTKKEILELMKL